MTILHSPQAEILWLVVLERWRHLSTLIAAIRSLPRLGDPPGAGGRLERQQVHRDVPLQRHHHVRPRGGHPGIHILTNYSNEIYFVLPNFETGHRISIILNLFIFPEAFYKHPHKLFFLSLFHK